MPYKYFGRKTNHIGKSLWEILGNLKNFGIGRVVTRTMYEKYPEPSYLKILKVETLPCPEVQTLDDMRKVKVWVEKTFRGKTISEPYMIQGATYKSDYKLIPKDEEKAFCNRKYETTNEEKIYPKYIAFPPLLRELIIREGQVGSQEEPKLEVIYSQSMKHKIAGDNEKPNVDILMNIDITKSKNQSLYKNVKL